MTRKAALTILEWTVLVSIGVSMGFFFDWLEIYVNNRP